MEHAASQIQDSKDLSGISRIDARVTKRAAVAKRELRPTALVTLGDVADSLRYLIRVHLCSFVVALNHNYQ